MNTTCDMAPEIEVSEWFNVASPITLADCRGSVVLIEAFQMLCPGCVAQGLPQAQRVTETFRGKGVLMIGLHSVFEHHEAQGHRAALAAFLHEYRIGFPVAIDRQVDQVPVTMTAYQMQGTPTLVLIDRQGRRRAQHFGSIPDMVLGAEIAQLLSEGDVKTAQPREALFAEIQSSADSCKTPEARASGGAGGRK